VSSKTIDFHSLFQYGMKRSIPALLPLAGVVLELGPGNTPTPWADCTLDWPEWDGDKAPLPFKDESLGAIVAFHFLEHFTGARVIALLRECERALRPGGTLTVVVPHRLGALSVEDLDHKSFWTEDTWKTLMRNTRYDKHRERPWRLSVGFNAIVGVAERNLALLTQLVKDVA